MEAFITQAPLFLVIILLIIGFVLLIKGADFFVEGSSSLAKRLHVPSLIIGLTVVAMGTSLPETAVSVTASLTDNNALAVSNAVGSNIFNLMVVIGLCALLQSLKVERSTIVRDIPLSVACAALLLLLGIIGIGDASGMTLGHMDGLLLVILFIGYIVLMVHQARKARSSAITDSAQEEDAGDDEIKLLSLPRSLLAIIFGAAAIAIGGDLTVDAASRIALDFGMSQTLVGLTIVSIGTSLPELVTSVVAARKNEMDMALGNAVGSNIFNILMVLGIASTLSPIAFLQENIIDIAVLLVFSLIVWIFAATRRRLGRAEGGIMLLLYLAYAVYIIMR